MKRAFKWLTFTIWLVAVPARGADPIPLVEHRRLELAVSEYLSGKTDIALAYFSALAASGSEARTAAVDEYLAEKKLPSLANLLAQARLKAIHNGTLTKLPRPRAKQILLELPVLVAGFDAQTNHVRKHPLLNQPLAEGLTVNEYERQLRTVQALFQSVTSAQELASALASLVKYVPPADRARLPAQQAETVKRDYHAEAESLQDLLRTLAGMDAALRVRRLRRAELALDPKASPAERLLAAHTWQEDSGRMDAFFATFKKGFHADGPEGLAELSDPALPGRVREQVERCRDLAGGLTSKVNELFAGLDLWVRGRYGEGPDVFGLAKAENSIDDRDAAHNLYLPLEPPRPTDPAKPDDQPHGVPHYARRHFHWWAWEDQQLATGQVFGAAGLADSNLHLTGRQGDVPYYMPYSGTQRHWGHFRFTYATPDDATLRGVNLKILSRLVGYVEYEQALDHFQRFLKGAKPAELQAADELVRDRDELAIYTNLSRFIEPPGRREAEQPTAADDTFERRGLEWVIGLARLEHQAMLVGFTANPSPLVALLPPPRPAEAYTELLLDGARMHYWAWRKARDQAKGALPEGADLVSEARRAVLILEFLQAAQTRSGGVIGGMADWQDEVARYLDEVVKRIQRDNELIRLVRLDAPRVLQNIQP